MNWCLNIYIHFNVLAANIGPTTNEKSIVMQVVHNNPQQQLFSLLLAGDMEGMAAIEIAQSLGSELQSTDSSESMYVTSPTSKICHLLCQSSFSIDNNCYEVLQISDSALDIEHPQAEDLDKDEGDRNIY